MPILRSQTVYSITVFLSLCFVTATYMCLALSQHHAALALSCALLCLSITLLLLSHVPCFVSASRCSCSLMCHHAALALSCALLCLSITLLLHSHVPCFVSASRCTAYHASLTPFLLSLMCLICLVSSCALLCLNITPLLRLTLSQGITLLFKCGSLCALLCPAQHHDALSSASPQHHAAHVPCLVSA